MADRGSPPQKKTSFRTEGGESPVEALKRATAATLRAIAERPDVTVSYTSGNAIVQGGEALLPSPPSFEMRREDMVRLRGTSDILALRLRYHDDLTHVKRQPKSLAARQVYDALEQARIETLGAGIMPGTARNIADLVEIRCRQEGYDRAHGREDVPIGEAMRLLAREAFLGQPLPPAAAAAAAPWRSLLSERALAALERLAGLARDQESFTRTARELLSALDLLQPGEELPEDEESDDQADEDIQNSEGDDGDEEEDDGSDSQSPPGEGDGQDGGSAADGDSGEQDGQSEDNLPVPGVGSDEAGGPVKQRPHPIGHNADPAAKGYSAFTTEFDQVIEAKDLCDPDELTRLRTQLDHQLSHLQGVVAKLANRMQRRLMAQQTRAWEFDLEEGILDAGRLARVVVNPLLALSFKEEKEMIFKDTVVSLLIDNSGSMRGRPITVAATSADILARTLERCGIKVEILGFTTQAWKGGQSREKWLNGGKPTLPGRLNDLRHIVYKGADSPWRRARKNLGLMLREGLLKENIDGEALLWAHQRLIGRPEQRRILMVISDGAPVDDSTLGVNSGSFLEKHLRDVIQWIEAKSPVELVAIGIGHDVTRYYRRAVTIMDAEDLGGTMLKQLTDLFEEEDGIRWRRPIPKLKHSGLG